MISTRVSPKGEITLPKRIRQALQVKPGDRVCFESGDKTVLLRSQGPSSARALAGALRRYRGNEADAWAANTTITHRRRAGKRRVPCFPYAPQTRCRRNGHLEKQRPVAK